MVSTLGTSSSCAQSRIRRSRLEPRFESIARARDRRYEFSRTFPFLSSLSLYNLLFRASSSYSIFVLPFPLAVNFAFSLTRHYLVIEIDPISNVISE